MYKESVSFDGNLPNQTIFGKYDWHDFIGQPQKLIQKLRQKIDNVSEYIVHSKYPKIQPNFSEISDSGVNCKILPPVGALSSRNLDEPINAQYFWSI